MPGEGETVESRTLSSKELKLIENAANIPGLREKLTEKGFTSKAGISFLREKANHFRTLFKGPQGPYADEWLTCRKLPELIESGKVSFDDLRAQFSEEEVGSSREPVQKATGLQQARKKRLLDRFFRR